MKLVASWLRANPWTQFARTNDEVVCIAPDAGALFLYGYGANDPVDAVTIASWLGDLVFAAEAAETWTPMAGAGVGMITSANSTATVDVFIFVWKELWEKERKPWGDTTVYA